MLKRIKITGYKSLKTVEVNLKPLTVLFGPNGVGKSNFLDALQLLSKIATSNTLKEAFEAPYRGKPLESFSFGADGLPGLLARGSVSFCIEADVELSSTVVESVNRQIREMRRDSGGSHTTGESAANPKKQAAVKERFLRYRIEVEMLPRSGILRVVDEYLAALNNQGNPTGKRQPFLSGVGDRLHLRMEGQAHPTYFERYLDQSILSKSHYAPHYPHLIAMRRELENWRFFYFEPRERMRTANPVKEVRHIGLMGEDLAALLNTLKALDNRQFKIVEKSLHTLLPSVEKIDVEVNDLGEVDLKLKEDGVSIPARLLSEGTLRMLGLLALAGAKEQPALVGFEEPENGIHPRRLELVAELLKTRVDSGETQYIVTTHSPLLPDLLPEDSLFICKKVATGTCIEPLETEGPIFKRSEIERAFADEPELTTSERILRGDFDA